MFKFNPSTRECSVQLVNSGEYRGESGQVTSPCSSPGTSPSTSPGTSPGTSPNLHLTQLARYLKPVEDPGLASLAMHVVAGNFSAIEKED